MQQPGLVSAAVPATAIAPGLAPAPLQPALADGSNTGLVVLGTAGVAPAVGTASVGAEGMKKKSRVVWTRDLDTLLLRFVTRNKTHKAAHGTKQQAWGSLSSQLAALPEFSQFEKVPMASVQARFESLLKAWQDQDPKYPWCNAVGRGGVDEVEGYEELERLLCELVPTINKIASEGSAFTTKKSKVKHRPILPPGQSHDMTSADILVADAMGGSAADGAEGGSTIRPEDGGAGAAAAGELELLSATGETRLERVLAAVVIRHMDGPADKKRKLDLEERRLVLEERLVALEERRLVADKEERAQLHNMVAQMMNMLQQQSRPGAAAPRQAP